MPTNSKLRRFPKSKIWDSKTRRIVDGLRAYIHREPQPTISTIQHKSLRERPLDESFHCFQDPLPGPGNDIREVLVQAIDVVKKIDYQTPKVESVTVEWIGKRSPQTAPADTTESNNAKWNYLTRDISTNLTIMHAHGGALFQGSPEAYRLTTSQLAALSGGRVVSVKYRLAPQNPFPAGLLDVFVTYLSLLYPHPNSAHQPLDPSTIVFAGDSIGANLLYALMQIILLTQNNPPITFHSRTVKFPLPLPAGLASMSFAGDTINSLPSFLHNRVHDLFLETPWSLPSYPACELWPAYPPRPEIDAATSAFVHPFISPALAHNCRGMPPLSFIVGEELFSDAANAVARRAAQQGVQVDWIQFQAMPHCFATLPGLDTSSQAKTCMRKWAAFCKDCVEPGDIKRPKVNAVKIEFRDGTENKIALEDGSSEPLPLSDVEQRIYRRIKQHEKEFQIAWQEKITSKL